MKQQEIQEIFSYNIKFIRSLTGYNQDEFSHLISVKRAALGSYEEGRCVPPLEKLKRICDIFILGNIEDLCFKKLPKTFEFSKTTKMSNRQALINTK